MPADLSGGEKQKVAIARALTNDINILLLDNPLESIDEITKGQLEEEIKKNS